MYAIILRRPHNYFCLLDAFYEQTLSILEYLHNFENISTIFSIHQSKKLNKFFKSLWI